MLDFNALARLRIASCKLAIVSADSKSTTSIAILLSSCKQIHLQRKSAIANSVSISFVFSKELSYYYYILPLQKIVAFSPSQVTFSMIFLINSRLFSMLSSAKLFFR